MFRAIAALGLLAVAACSSPAPEIDVENPYASLYPWNAERSDVVTTPSGLQYIEIKAGPNGGVSPSKFDKVTVHYDGRLAATGEKFDASYDRGQPSTFGVDAVIAGWTEALQLMSEGDEWMLYIPSELAYGDQARGDVITANSNLMFRVELQSVEVNPFGANFPWNAEADGVTTTESGVQYVVNASGPADGETPTALATATVDYEGRVARTGEKFDSSFDRGQPASFQLNRVIPGWTEVVQLMRPGDDWIAHIPAALAYGDNPPPGGVIQAGDDLMFRIVLRDFIPAPAPPAEEIWTANDPWDSSAEGVTALESGVQYVVIKSGAEDGPTPELGNRVQVHYEGRLTDGTVFDSSIARAQPAVFGRSQVIPGWQEVLGLMRPGDEWLVFIPSDKAYGAAGAGDVIPPDANLLFEVRLLDVL